ATSILLPPCLLIASACRGRGAGGRGVMAGRAGFECVSSIQLAGPISTYTSIFCHLVRVFGALYRGFFQPLDKEKAMQTDHSETVQAQFDSQAQAYLQSAVHAGGPDLLRAGELISQSIPAASGRFLDVGCGAGHLSFAVAGALASVVAVDPSPNMLATVQRAANEKGLANIQTVQAGAESMPFDDDQFCVVASRYSAHHWLKLPEALKEMHRVVKPGGYLLMIDVEGDENPLVDTYLQAIEVLRDRSHIRDRSPSEWERLI